MDKDKMDLALSIARSYYQYHVPIITASYAQR